MYDPYVPTSTFAPTEKDFEKIAAGADCTIQEFVPGNAPWAMLAPKNYTDADRVAGKKSIVMLYAKRIDGEWQFWVDEKLEGMKVIGEIAHEDNPVYRYIVKVP